jgi:NADPH:quinone reductase
VILGATGGVGVLATQLAVRAGITVIATARGEAGAWIRGFGASETIDYTQRPVTAALAAAHPDGVDAVLDLTGNTEQVTGVARQVRDAGTVISTAFGVPGELSSQNRIIVANYQLDDKPARLKRVTGALAAGHLVIPVQDEVTLVGAAAAIAHLRRGGARGKTLIRMRGSPPGSPSAPQPAPAR